MHTPKVVFVNAGSDAFLQIYRADGWLCWFECRQWKKKSSPNVEGAVWKLDGMTLRTIFGLSNLKEIIVSP